ncbi:hypothetical protein [Nocardioides sp. Kera G14]|uniref:hypothetical protein n=1 Tax=Nocardioides sp. Kera G14 TaxID=2884264 RepID=UPI001D1010B2|nr:hypothetical protein [Nocardioides sp. Kera G14]UDY24921.1 hypothetical protein LH076_06415 [Nocardioides sp. Kera G14]
MVLLSHGLFNDRTNPYIVQLARGMSGTHRVEPLSPWRALTSTPDIFHLHWPHQLVRGSTPLRTAIKMVTSAVLIRRLRRRRVPVVWTVHNIEEHETGGRLERALVRRLERLVSLRIFLNESPANDRRLGVVVLHSSYRPWLANRHIDLGVVQRTHGEGLLFFGLLRRYKGIEHLLAVAGETGLALTVAGHSWSADYASKVAAAAATWPHITFEERFLDDAELVDALARHRCVMLPYEQMYNSGAVLMALSAGRPVIAPESPSNAALAAEVGPEWLRLYDVPLTAHKLLEADRTSPAGLPDLSRRDWETALELHAAIYDTVSASSSRLRTADPLRDQRRNRIALEEDPRFASHSALNEAQRA